VNANDGAFVGMQWNIVYKFRAIYFKRPMPESLVLPEHVSTRLPTCKIDDTVLISWFEDKINARTVLHVSKMKYVVQVLNVTQKLNTNTMGTRAYPSVGSSVTEMPFHVRNWLKYLYDSETAIHFVQASFVPDFNFTTNCGVTAIQQSLANTMWTEMPYFTAQGYALGTAFASAQSGDTVSTVLVGGMVTVRNGGFSCRPGEPIMWYFEFEEDLFHS